MQLSSYASASMAWQARLHPVVADSLQHAQMLTTMLARCDSTRVHARCCLYLCLQLAQLPLQGSMAAVCFCSSAFSGLFAL